MFTAFRKDGDHRWFWSGVEEKIRKSKSIPSLSPARPASPLDKNPAPHSTTPLIRSPFPALTISESPTRCAFLRPLRCGPFAYVRTVTSRPTSGPRRSLQYLRNFKGQTIQWSISIPGIYAQHGRRRFQIVHLWVPSLARTGILHLSELAVQSLVS